MNIIALIEAFQNRVNELAKQTNVVVIFNTPGNNNRLLCEDKVGFYHNFLKGIWIAIGQK